ncbi:hypothetical protein DPMN_098425 [Dreissena polymorpha]|uniref:Uncharacterized protein n=1 Tax=Dreissena polymorpha TaxID=45954 RepID=A0A9D4R794_DREPO|nr:hypothetical protein DPMN_098425 [Dreissena polymorpha]
MENMNLRETLSNQTWSLSFRQDCSEIDNLWRTTKSIASSKETQTINEAYDPSEPHMVLLRILQCLPTKHRRKMLNMVSYRSCP